MIWNIGRQRRDEAVTDGRDATIVRRAVHSDFAPVKDSKLLVVLYLMFVPLQVGVSCRDEKLAERASKDNAGSEHSNASEYADVSGELFRCEDFFAHKATEGRLVWVGDALWLRRCEECGRTGRRSSSAARHIEGERTKIGRASCRERVSQLV